MAARLGLVVALLTAFACENTEPDAQGQTHWLLPCDSTVQCNGFECVCGYCTQECSVDSECVMGMRQGNCVKPENTTRTSCEVAAPERAICLPREASDTDDDASVPEDGGSDDSGT